MTLENPNNRLVRTQLFCEKCQFSFQCMEKDHYPQNLKPSATKKTYLATGSKFPKYFGLGQEIANLKTSGNLCQLLQLETSLVNTD